MKCPACGRENRGGAGFCAWCGTRLQLAEPPQPQAEAENPEAPEALLSGRPTVKLVPDVPETPVQSQEAAEQPAQEEEPAQGAGPLHAPLPLGEIIADRYQISDVLEGSPDHNTYRALDLAVCLNCGAETNAPGDEYCSQCGSALERWPYVTIVEQVPRAPEQYDRRFTENERDYYVKQEPDEAFEEEEEADEPVEAFRIIWGRATDQGQQRDHNEDYLEGWLYARGTRSLVSLFVVADGVGGQDSGEVASRMTTETVWQSLRKTVWEPVVRGEALAGDAIDAALRQAVLAANQAVYDARIARSSQMGSTLTMALVVGGTAYVANVGDSRTYLWNASGLRRITKDHSLVQRLVDTGQIAPRDVYVHPQRNLIYQSMGDRPEVRPDIFRAPLQVDDRLVLCSDGLWEMVRDEGIEEVLLSEPDPQRACDRLVNDANLAGGEDNIAVIIAQVTPA